MIVACLVATSCTSGDVDADERIDVAPTTAVTSADPDGGPRLVERDDWGLVFSEADAVGTIAIREVGSTDTHVWNPARALEPRRPASTFKILNSLIILETGVLDGVDTITRWDGVTRGLPVWNQDHSLRSGIEVSAVWMFQQLAREVGTASMIHWLNEAEYGNASIGSEIDDFWLVGDLRISPLEQLDFLERLVTRDLPFDPMVMDSVADIIVQERGSQWSWSFKTGTALIEDPDLGWLVGMTEYDGTQWVFALNIDLTSTDALEGQLDPQLRQTIARSILVLAGALPS